MAEVFPYERWTAQLPALHSRYNSAGPFPHIVLDDFASAPFLDECVGAFPSPKSAEWVAYKHVNEKKQAITEKGRIQPVLQSMVDAFQSPRFVEFLGGLTGIQGLLADEAMEGGGLHQVERGGYLNIHADFTVHPKKLHWRRQVNLILYLNKDWQDVYGGHLELWDPGMTKCWHKIAPVFNRAVIFNTYSDAFHGHPDPLECPEETSRKSLALYYFTEEAKPLVRSTEYRARPGDRGKALIYLDNLALRAYGIAKRRLGISDRTIGRVLKVVDRVRGRPPGK
jgi:hypothetical protein